MKRSKMLQVIAEIIYFNDKFDQGDLEEAEELASHILNNIEKHGMLPPTVNVPAFGVKDNMWEPEDD